MTDPAQAAAKPSPAQQARALARACRKAVLATTLQPGLQPAEPGGPALPYASLVLVAFDHDATPLLLISQLAEHTRNILAAPDVSLLRAGTEGYAEPLTGPRATLLARAELTQDPRHRARFLARHPGAALYADFKDSAFYKLTVSRAHIVAGFGRIHWFDDYRYTADWAALAEAAAGIVAHMNDDHADAVQLYAGKLLGLGGEGWQLCGVDPEGADLIGPDGALARLAFDKPVRDAEGARVELVRLVKRARQTP